MQQQGAVITGDFVVNFLDDNFLPNEELTELEIFVEGMEPGQIGEFIKDKEGHAQTITAGSNHHWDITLPFSSPSCKVRIINSLS